MIKFFVGIVDPGTFKNLNPKPLTNTPSGNSITKSFINENSNKFNLLDHNLGSQFDDIVANGDQYGHKTEDLIKEVIEDSGDFTWFDGSTGNISTTTGRGINGFDGVFVKGPLDNPTEIIINESKQWTGGSVSLSGLAGNNPAQMTNEWIDKVANDLLTANPPRPQLSNAILDAKIDGNLTKIVTVIDRTRVGNADNLVGGISIIKVN